MYPQIGTGKNYSVTNEEIMIGRHETGAYRYIDTNVQFVIAIEEIQRCIQIGQTIAVVYKGVNLSNL